MKNKIAQIYVLQHQTFIQKQKHERALQVRTFMQLQHAPLHMFLQLLYNKHFITGTNLCRGNRKLVFTAFKFHCAVYNKLYIHCIYVYCTPWRTYLLPTQGST